MRALKKLTLTGVEVYAQSMAVLNGEREHFEDSLIRKKELPPQKKHIEDEEFLRVLAFSHSKFMVFAPWLMSS